MNRTHILQLAYICAYQAVLVKNVNVLVSNALAIKACYLMTALRKTV